MMSVLRRILLVLAASACVSLASPGEDTFEAATTPSKDVTMSFTLPGRIAEMHVRVGDKVTAGQPLARLDDTVERAQLAQLQAQAEDTTRIKAAEARLAQSEVDLAKIEAAWNTDPDQRAVTEFERDQARLEVEVRRLSLELEQFNHAQDQRRYEEARLSLDKMELLSPVDGTVEVLFVEEGESVDGLQQVVHIVDVDPLWIDAPIPLALARGLSVGGAAQVSFGRDGADTQNGEIIHVASVGDAASSTLRVRVELANPTGRPAGERVVVSFPAGPAAVGAFGPATPRAPQKPPAADDRPAVDTDDSNDSRPPAEQDGSSS